MTSEPIFIGMIASGITLPLITIFVASVTNTAGSVVTFLLARAAGTAGGGKWMPISLERRARIEAWYSKWGLWSLLLSWIPGGDLLVVFAGFARAPVLAVVTVLAIAKTVRFGGLALLTVGLFG